MNPQAHKAPFAAAEKVSLHKDVETDILAFRLTISL
jgi:hypothetical protein